MKALGITFDTDPDIENQTSMKIHACQRGVGRKQWL